MVWCNHVWNLISDGWMPQFLAVTSHYTWNSSTENMYHLKLNIRTRFWQDSNEKPITDLRKLCQMMVQVSVSNSAALFILILATLVFCARRLFSHFISPLLDTCFNSWFLSDLLLVIPSLFSRAWPPTLILLHAVFHPLSPSLPISPGLSLIHAYIYLFHFPLFSVPRCYQGHAAIYLASAH